ncbi:amino acid adenylation domain-containing protein [Streptomyces tremellae]
MGQDAPGTRHGARGPRRAETMHGLFQWCVRRHPDAVAIVHGERRVTYAELDAASDDMAAELEASGVGPGARVAVLMPRTAEFVTALLAVLKRGAAYAALDPRWPRARVDDLLGRVAAQQLVTSAEGTWPVPVLDPSGWDFRTAAAGPRRPTPVDVAPHDAACVFFTSGTTGAPKAVTSPHRATVRLFDDCEFAELGPGNVLPQTAPVPWDGFTLDCWSVLLNGGTSVFVDEPLLPAAVRDLVARHGVNGAFLTTALFNMLVDEDIHAFDGFSWLITGGERASTRRLRRFLDTHPGVALRNVYGPVESTVLATAHRVTHADCDDPSGIPLGHVLNGTQAFVMDELRPCATGEVGEILLAGEGLVEGYLGDEELTAAAFVEVDVDGTPHRCYRTGDLGHLSATGTLYFDGRADRQVKIRGHRVEPAEIEQCAERITGVSAAAVVPLPGADGRPETLALFYTTADGATVDEVALRAQLVRRLPEYLLPGRLHHLAALPLLANGKTDFDALRRTAPRPTAPVLPGQAPRTGTERAVAAQIAAILALPDCARDASFFTLGANSLDVARLCARVDERLGVPIPPSRIFALQTVAAIAAWVDGAPAPQPPAPPPARAGDPDDTAVALPAYQGLYLFEGVDERADVAYVCPMAWWIDGPLDAGCLSRAAQDVQDRHEALRARYRMQEGPTALLGGTIPDVEFHHMPDQENDTAARTALSGTLFRPLSLAGGPVWRCVLVRSRGSGRWLFGLVVHHIAFDGASEPVLSADLSTAYAARVRGTAPAFNEPSPSLAQVSAEHARRCATVDTAAQQTFWDEELAGLPALDLPQRLPGTALVGPKAHAEDTVAAEELEAWESDARLRGATRLTYAAAVYGLVLARFTGQLDFAVLVPFLRRDTTVGAAVTCRVDTMCLRLRLPDAAAPALDEVAAVTRRAMAALDVPFLDAARSVRASGRLHTILDLPVLMVDDDPDVPLRLTGCTSRALPLDTPTTMTQLELRLTPAPDGGLRCTATVWTDRLPAAFAQDIVDAFTAVLRRGPAR